MVVKCITEQEVEIESTGVIQKIRSIKGITLMYLKTEFLLDLISVLPFHMIFGNLESGKERFMLLKVLRLKNVSKVLKTSSAINLLRDLTKYKALKMTENQNKDDKLNNHTHIV
jgi:hypothetical protein